MLNAKIFTIFDENALKKSALNIVIDDEKYGLKTWTAVSGLIFHLLAQNEKKGSRKLH